MSEFIIQQEPLVFLLILSPQSHYLSEHGLVREYPLKYSYIHMSHNMREVYWGQSQVVAHPSKCLIKLVIYVQYASIHMPSQVHSEV